MNCQMMRVISSPSISTTGFFTLIFAMSGSHHLFRNAAGNAVGSTEGSARKRKTQPGQPRRLYSMAGRGKRSCPKVGCAVAALARSGDGIEPRARAFIHPWLGEGHVHRTVIAPHRALQS